MAENLVDGEFWLPSEFLAEGVVKKNGGNEKETRVCFPSEFPYDFESYGSILSSPTETESDEGDYMAGLTQQMTHFTVQNQEKIDDSFANEKNHKTRVLASSPESTLYWSTHRSSAGPSPPANPLEQKDYALDLLYAAAGEVVKMKKMNEGQSFDGRGILGPPIKPTSHYTVNPNQGFCQQRLQTNQLKQSPMVKQQWQNRVRPGGFGNGRKNRPMGLSYSTWPLQDQHQNNLGMRAVFLGGSGSKKESGGTGVFLPRRAGSPTDLCKKPACATVLLPARLVQTLNLNLDEMGNALPRFSGSFNHDNEPKRHNLRPPPSSSNEIRLPKEWIY
ncbi:uncharacterized protein LOC143878456 [Tasmannia lanceolata]|uniref:uncharacterized protein LOC143878456 n=1 Tax=Tasmannia lanceolata TaxID=3420 RepID=UPI00406369F5